MTAHLGRRGYQVAACTVDRLMRDLGLNGVSRARTHRTTMPAKDGSRAGDLLDRDFTAPTPNTVWVADFTYVRTWAGLAYVAFVVDAEELAEAFPDSRRVRCDQGFRRTFVERVGRWGTTTTGTSRVRGGGGFHVLPRRWVVERVFSSIGHARRRARHVERLASTSITMVEAPYVQMMPRRSVRAAQPSTHT